MDDKIGMELHQKSFKGEKLTKQEEANLTAWYAQQDQLEAATLNVRTTGNTIEQLREQITTVLNELAKLTQHIQQIAKENEGIRQENARLLQLLMKKSKAA